MPSSAAGISFWSRCLQSRPLQEVWAAAQRDLRPQEVHKAATAQPPSTLPTAQAAAVHATQAPADALPSQPAALALPPSSYVAAAQQETADYPAAAAARAEARPAQAALDGAGAAACGALQARSAAASILAVLQDPGFDAYVDRTEELWQALIARDGLSAEQRDAALVQAALAASAGQ